ncbi:glutaredoxin-1 [Trichomonascus vanleenenianus]|uniref:glutaredoxin n=1 Tax=Trichomonascus vanleenenianus TaxID=2268995 RepID=UPI003ECB949B
MTPHHVETIRSLIKSNAVFLASKSYCPYCNAAKRTLINAGARAKIIELDKMDEGRELQKALETISGMRTVPQIFIGGKLVGGNSDLEKVKPETLKDMILKAADTSKL